MSSRRKVPYRLALLVDACSAASMFATGSSEESEIVPRARRTVRFTDLPLKVARRHGGRVDVADVALRDAEVAEQRPGAKLVPEDFIDLQVALQCMRVVGEAGEDAAAIGGGLIAGLVVLVASNPDERSQAIAKAADARQSGEGNANQLEGDARLKW
ncbi:hypothetical protein TYRP_001080 [Tyrophagus putrescentiae]|nr:hypothetical protein TYRP_001080 [Tyrophagus putrescentiae]